MERDGRLMAQARTTAITKRIDDMLDSWAEYEADRKTYLIVCRPCSIGDHYCCRGEDVCGCDECDYAEGVSVHGR